MRRSRVAGRDRPPEGADSPSAREGGRFDEAFETPLTSGIALERPPTVPPSGWRGISEDAEPKGLQAFVEEARRRTFKGS